MKYPVTRFTSLRAALKELEAYILNGEHLQTGKPFNQLGGLRSREALANLLLCIAVNSVTKPDRLTFTSAPSDVGGDGIIYDTETEETWKTEHVMVPNLPGSTADDTEALILEKIELKRSKGGEAYAAGKTLVVFLNACSGVWFPNNVTKRLPAPLYFDAVWVVGLQGVEDGEYVYTVTRLDLSQGNAPTWRIRIGRSFDAWLVEVIQ
jgi:hypothetical protein